MKPVIKTEPTSLKPQFPFPTKSTQTQSSSYPFKFIMFITLYPKIQNKFKITNPIPSLHIQNNKCKQYINNW